MASNARYPRSNARRQSGNGNRGWMWQNKPSNSSNNSRDDEEDDCPPRPNNNKTYVSLISDDEDEEEEDGKTASQKRNVSYIDTPNNSPATKRIASSSVSRTDRTPFAAASTALPASGFRTPPAPFHQNDTVTQLAARVHETQDENEKLRLRMAKFGMITAEKDAEIASLRAIIEENRQTAAKNSSTGIGPVQQNPNGQQQASQGPAKPCTSCGGTDMLKREVADFTVNLAKARSTVVHQHDEIKELREEVKTNKAALAEERAAAAQYKISIDQLTLNLEAEQATVKNLHTTLAENQVTIDNLNQQLAAQSQELASKNQELDTQRQWCSTQGTELSEARATIADLKSQLAYKQHELEVARSQSEEDKTSMAELNIAIEDFKKQVANGQASLDNARTTLFVNGTIMQDLKDQVVATSKGDSSGGANKDKDKLPDLEAESLRVRLKDSEHEIETLKQRLDKAEKECEGFRTNYHKNQQEKENFGSNFKSVWEKEHEANTRVEGLEEELARQQRELVESEAELRQQQERVGECEARLEQQRQAFDQEKEMMETVIASLEDELTRLRSEAAPEMETLKATLQSVNEQLSRVQSERDEAVKDANGQRDMYQRQAGKLESSKKASDMSRAYVTSLKNQLATKGEQVAHLEEKVKDLEVELAACQNWAIEGEAQRVQAQEELQRHKAQDDKNLETIKQHEATIIQLDTEVAGQSQTIQTMQATIAELQAQLHPGNGPGNQAAMQAHIAHLESRIQQKDMELASAKEQLDRLFNQYNDLTHERAKLAESNKTLSAHINKLGAERDQVLHTLEATKAALLQAEDDADFFRRREKALEEGGDPEFAHMESEWAPKLRDAKAQHEEASRELERCRQKVEELQIQLQTVSRQKNETLQQLESSRGQLAKFQLTVEDLNSQLSKAAEGCMDPAVLSSLMETGSTIDPVVKDMLQKAREIQSAGDIPRKDGNGVSSMEPTAHVAIVLPMALRAEPFPDCKLKSLKKEGLYKMIRDLEAEHERIDDAIRALIMRVRAEKIKTAALEKEVRVWKAISTTKDMLIDQATARLLGSPHGAEIKDHADIGFDLDFNERSPKPELDVEMIDVMPPRKSLVMTFGPTRKGYQCWKGDDLPGYDRLDVDASKQDRLGYLTGKGKSIFKYLEDRGCPLHPEVPGPSPGPIMVSAPHSEASMDIDDEETGSRYTASEIASSPLRPLAPSLRSSSSHPSPASLPPVELGVARRGGASSIHYEPPSTPSNTQSYTSAVYPAPTSTPSHRGFPRGRYTASRFRPSSAPAFAGPSYPPRRTSAPTSTPQSWAAGDFVEQDDIDMEVLGSGFTMESIEQPEELKPEPPTNKGKGKERAGSGPAEGYGVD
ncbi:uncharacterized protein QC763_506350 [Podospora pseudopauciseta]|uniref:Uncharacterized protein n=1 Tax=Podospora pseudopauciseta TaxID=2093780 RepID=A0ABR0H9S1_9PEZI|nr:hypothetical protein QC763_506350 [Podospora pseudopauciseta]